MGGYVVAEAPLGEGEAQVVLLATGTEVGLAMDARAKLAALTSMPVWYRCLARTVLTASRRSIVSRSPAGTAGACH